MTRITNIPSMGEFGVFVDDLDWKNTTKDEWLELGKLHLEKLVMIIRKSGLKKKSFYQVIKKWGEDRQNFASTLFARFPQFKGNIEQLMMSPDVPRETKEIVREFWRVGADDAYGNTLRISGKKINGHRIGMFAEGELLWHSNESGDIAFTPGVALLGVEGMTRSATGFMETTNYYYGVSDSFRSELDEMILVHNFVPGRINPGLNEPQDNLMYKNMCPDPNTEIPLVIESPAGIKGLHFSFNTVTGIKGMSDVEAEKVLGEIRKELVKEKYTYDYWWENDDDLLIFDNSIMQHRRLGDTTDRLALRYQFDYTHVQQKSYMPYFQEPYRSRYMDRMYIIFDMMQHMGKTMPVF